MEFDNIVTLKSRTGETLSVTYDSRAYEVHPKKGIKVPRRIAELGISQNAFRWDPHSGAIVESKLFIEEDAGPDALPSENVDPGEVAKVKQTDGLGNDKVLVDNKFVNKTRINLNPGKESFEGNNR